MTFSLSPIVSPKLLMSSLAVSRYQAVFHALHSFRSVDLPLESASVIHCVESSITVSVSSSPLLMKLFDASSTVCLHTVTHSLCRDALPLDLLRRVRRGAECEVQWLSVMQ